MHCHFVCKSVHVGYIPLHSVFSVGRSLQTSAMSQLVSFVRIVLWLQDIFEALCTAAAHAGGVSVPTTEAA